MTNIPFSGARLWDSLMEMAKIGATPKGGCNRQTLTDLDKEGRELFRSWVEQPEPDGERAAASEGGLHVDPAVVAGHDGRRDRQPEPDALDRQRVRVGRAEEPVEEVRLVLQRDPQPGVGDPEDRLVARDELP